MTCLEDLRRGVRVVGIVPHMTVTVEDVRWHGTTAITVAYRTPQGQLAEQLLYRDHEAALEIAPDAPQWDSAADGALLRLVLEAQRIKLAHLFDSRLAVHLSHVEPLPHQITAVYHEMVPRQPLRYMLADDPGAGKTIMAGLLIKELMLRDDVQRCLIVCPGSLVEQWQDELDRRFHLPFTILTRDAFESARTNWFYEHGLVIARLDHLSRNEEMQGAVSQIEWDLVIVDEAHKMAASFFGGEVTYTKRYQLGQLLSAHTRHMLLLTATPHNGKEEDFQLFLALLDPDRFEGRFRDGVHHVETSDLMRRLVKEQLLRFDGTPLFPERIATTVPYDLSPPEAALYEDITTYVRQEFDRAEALTSGRKGTVGFALTILQRRLASSPEAVYQSLRRRRERLARRLDEERANKTATLLVQESLPQWTLEDADDFEDLAGDERESDEEQVLDRATAAQTIVELEAEIARLTDLETQAAAVLRSRRDTKWDQVSSLLQSDETLRDSDGRLRKLVVFTEHRDTLNYLVERIRGLLGRPEMVVAIHGGVPRAERLRTEAAFREQPEVLILVATDAAGEGINLQRAHLMINYDLPWNPNRLEQRFGRIHRIGQTEVCHLWNLVAANTREGAVYEQLLRKLDVERAALGGRVFNVLGKLAFNQRPLRELLLEAIRYGDSPDVRARLTEAVDNALDRQQVQALLAERALTSDVFDQTVVQRVRADMELAQARRLQPHFITAFFRAAFEQLGGTLRERETARFEVTHVPQSIRQYATADGRRQPVTPRYERITFEKERVTISGKSQAALVAPGHPLLDATLDVTLHRYSTVLQAGGVLVDPADNSTVVRVLVALDHAIQNGRQHPLSRRIHFVELAPDGTAHPVGSAPYLDYRPLTPSEQALVEAAFSPPTWTVNLDNAALDYAITTLVPAHLADVRQHTEARIRRVQRAVHDRLTKESMYWDRRSVVLQEQERAGRTPKVNSLSARQRAVELAERLERRMALLEQERHLASTPPHILSRVLVVPAGLIVQMLGETDQTTTQEATHNRQVELRAMAAVMQGERALGYEPRDVSADKRGYDVESRRPDGSLRLIEVKGRTSGGDTVSITRNEILTALNVPDAWLLALVSVPRDDQPCAVRVLPPFFERDRDFAETSVEYNWRELWHRATPLEAD